MAILGFPSTSIIDSTSAGRALLTAANASAQRTLLGLGTSDSPYFLSLFLTGNISVAGAYYDSTNSPGTSGQVLKSTATGTDWVDPYDLVGVNADFVKTVPGNRFVENLQTGVLYGGVITINALDNTKIDISAGAGIIVSAGASTTAMPVPTVTTVTWSAKIGVSLTYLATNDVTWISLNSSGNVVQSTSAWSDTGYETQLCLGIAVHPDNVSINFTKQSTHLSYGQSTVVDPFVRAFGPLKLSGNTISAYSNNLQISRSSGTAYSLGANYVNDPNNPNIVADTDANPITQVCYYYRDGAGGFNVQVGSLIDPTKYDNGSGTLQTASGGKYTIQRLFSCPTQPNLIGVYYGYEEYNSIEEAEANIPYEAFAESELTAKQGVFCAYLIVKANSSNLSNAADAKFIQAGLFRSISTVTAGGQAITSLDDLTDVVITSPLDGNFLRYNAATSSWVNGTGVDGTGTANYVAKWSDSDTITNSIIFDNGTNIGIGTASPLSLLHIQQGSSGQAISNMQGLLIENNGNAAGTYVFQTATAAGKIFTITNSGNVGIGTTSPAQRLSVFGGSILVQKTSADGDKIFIGSSGADAGANDRLQITPSKIHSVQNTASFTITGDNLDYSSLTLYGRNHATSAGHVVIRSQASVGPFLSYFTPTGLGLGTSSPATTLDVAGDVTIADKIIHSGDTNTAIRFPSNDTISFETSGVETMRITSTNRVGIGTTSPIYNLDVAGTGIGTTDINARRFIQTRDGVPTSNLGAPTVTEIAAFQEQYDNKLAFYPPANITYETFDGTTWTEVVLTDTVKKNLVGGDAGTVINIPYGTTRFRFTIRNKNAYVNVNALYAYFSGQGHSTQVHIWSKHDSGSWVQNTNSTNLVAGWPAHLYLPFSGLWWLIGGTLGTHVNDIRIEFIPTWNVTYPANGIQIYRMQLWGGYPAAKRTIFSVDADQNVAFPAQISIGNNPNKAIISYTTNTQRTFTIPPVSGDRTFAFREEAQTFSGNQTFSGSIINTGSGTTFLNRIGIGDGSGTPYTNTGSPGVWLSYNGAQNAFMGMASTTTWGAYVGGDWRMAVTAGGNVGIGTTSPLYPLDIRRTVFSSLIHFSGGTTPGDAGGYLWSYTDDMAVIAAGSVYNTGGNLTAKATTASDLYMYAGNFSFRSDSGLTVGNSYTPTIRFSVQADGSTGVGSNWAKGEKFYVASGSMVLDNNQSIKFVDSANNNRRVILTSSANDVHLGHVDTGWGATTYLKAGNGIVMTTNYAVSAVNALYIMNSGRIGINTSGPQAKLDIIDTTEAGSGSLAGSILNLAQTWNTTGIPTAVKLNVTNTASSGNGRLIDLQVDSVTKFNVTRDGVVRNAAIAAAYADGMCITANATNRCLTVGYLNANTVQFGSTTSIGWTAGTDSYAALETILVRDAAYTIAQRNGLNPQVFRLYNTYTNDSNYERAKMAWSSNVLQIGTEEAGTGLARAMVLQTDGTTRVTISASTPTITFGTDGSPPQIFSFSGQSYTSNGNGKGLTLYTSSNSANDFGIALSGDGFTATSGSGCAHVVIARTFAPTSGTAVFNFLRVQPIINQTGGANGITRGIFINPTLTAAADYRALETDNNTGWAIYTSGTANSYFGGNVGIGTTSPATLFHISTVTAEVDFLRFTASGQNLSLKYMATPNSFVFTSSSGRNINFNNSGNVGIGFDTAPSQKLHVSGNVRVTGAYYDSNNDPGTSGQILSSTATGTNWVTLSELTGVDGTGTANYVAKWTDTDTIANSQIFDNGTNVGVGTTSPQSRLSIYGAGTTTGVTLTLENGGNISALNDPLGIIDFYSNDLSTGANGSRGNIAVRNEFNGNWDGNSARENTYIAFSTASSRTVTEKVRITSDGKVGIGTASPAEKLQISAGNILLDANYGVRCPDNFRLYDTTSSIDRFLFSTSNTYNTRSGGSHLFNINGSQVAVINSSGNLGVGINSPVATVDIKGSTGSGYSLLLRSGDTSTATGAVQIGFGFGNTATYVHSIRTRHNSGAAANNAIDFWLWQQGVDSSTTIGSLRVMTIDGANNGSVGIGTTSPGAKLQVNGAGATAIFDSGVANDGRLEFKYNGTTVGKLGYNPNETLLLGDVGCKLSLGAGNLTRMTITAAGNVGIGTDAPDTKLDVRNGIITAGSQISTSGSEILRGYYSNGALTVIGTEHSSGGPVIGYAVKPSTTTQGEFTSTTPISVQRTAYSLSGGFHRWFVGAGGVIAVDSAVAMTEAMRLANSGNLGIGTNSPASRLHLRGVSGTLLRIGVNDANADTVEGGIQWYSNEAVTADYFGGLKMRFQGGSGNANRQMQFLVGDLATPKMVVTGSGFVGIGTLTPDRSFVVAGNNSGAFEGAMLYNANTTSTAEVVFRLGVFNTTSGLDIRQSSNASGPSWASGSYDSFIRASQSGSKLHLAAGGSSTANVTIWNTNLGVGTTAPDFKIHSVVDSNTPGNATTALCVRNINVGTAADTRLYIGNDVSHGAGAIIMHANAHSTRANELAIVNSISDSTSKITFATNNSVERMRIDSSGNIGIGTTSPNHRLTISGNINFVNGTDYITWRNGDIKLTRLQNGSGYEFSVETYDGTSLGERFRIHRFGDVGVSVSRKIGAGVGYANGTGSASYADLELYNASTGKTTLNNQSYAIGIQTAGVDRITVLNGGNVGIGQTSPTAPLHVSRDGGASTVKLLQVDNSNATYQQNMILEMNTSKDILWSQGSASGGTFWNSGTRGYGWSINATRIVTFDLLGNVGIGTSSPTTKLEVYDTANGTIKINNGTYSSSWSQGNSYITTFAMSASGKITWGTSAELLFATTTDTSLYRLASGYFNSNNSTMSFAAGHDGYFAFETYATSTRYNAIGSVRTDNNTSGLIFNTKAAGVDTERVRITSAGNVGIGTNSPSYRLHINGGSMYLDHSHAFYTSDIRGTSGLYLNQGTAANVLLVTGGGNVGIGTASPTAKLDVNGDIKFTSLNVNGVAGVATETATVASTNLTQIASFVAATYTSCKFLVQARDTVTGERQVTEILVVTDGTTAYSTEYGVVFTGSAALATFSVDINAGNCRLLAQRTTANSTQYKVLETVLVA